MRTDELRFLSRLNKQGKFDKKLGYCWEIIQSNSSKTWGNKSPPFRLQNGTIKTIQSFSFSIFNPDWDGKGNVYSICKNPLCANPDHLVLKDPLLSTGVEFYRNKIRYRICPSCKQEFIKSVENFYISKSGSFLKCKSCSVKSTIKSRMNKWARVLLYEAQKRNKENGVDCSITIDDIISIYTSQNGKCYWTGLDMTPSIISKFPSKPSLDRLDRFKGYTLDNVVLCCLAINIGRNSSSKDVFEQFILNLKNKGIDTSLWK